MYRREFLASLGASSVVPRSEVIFQSRTLVSLETKLGTITVALAIERASLTAHNFLRYVAAKRYDGASFYRAFHRPEDSAAGLIQGGILDESVQLFPPVAHESTQHTGLSHREGTLSMARYAPGTATCHFFICLGDMSMLDAHPAKPADNSGFAAFGQVVSGMDVVRVIAGLPTSPTAGEGVMRGQMLEPPVPITRAVIM